MRLQREATAKQQQFPKEVVKLLPLNKPANTPVIGPQITNSYQAYYIKQLYSEQDALVTWGILQPVPSQVKTKTGAMGTTHSRGSHSTSAAHLR